MIQTLSHLFNLSQKLIKLRSNKKQKRKKMEEELNEKYQSQYALDTSYEVIDISNNKTQQVKNFEITKNKFDTKMDIENQKTQQPDFTEKQNGLSVKYQESNLYNNYGLPQAKQVQLNMEQTLYQKEQQPIQSASNQQNLNIKTTAVIENKFLEQQNILNQNTILDTVTKLDGDQNKNKEKTNTNIEKKSENEQLLNKLAQNKDYSQINYGIFKNYNYINYQTDQKLDQFYSQNQQKQQEYTYSEKQKEQYLNAQEIKFQDFKNQNIYDDKQPPQAIEQLEQLVKEQQVFSDQGKSQTNQGNIFTKIFNKKSDFPNQLYNPTIINKCNPLNTNIKNKIQNPNLSIKIEDIIKYAPLKQFSISIKQTIYNKLIQSLSDEDKKQELHILRCVKDIDLPKNKLCEELLKTELKQQQDTFSYFKPPHDECHWYLNFADNKLFGFYTSALYAQDELQCTEMPMLAHVKEYLETQRSVPNLKPRTQEKDEPTPVLIVNVPRIGTIDINPDQKYRQGLYGNNFRQLKEQDLPQKLTIFEKENLVYTNIIAMSAIGYGNGQYTKDQIIFTLYTAYKAFRQALEITNLYYPNQKCVIHTGNWGCGAFGNNYQLIAILQILAANLAGVDKMYYHTFSQHGTDQFNIGQAIYYQIIQNLASNKGEVKISKIIEEIQKKKFVWGQSDGN
ncbi:poly (ADP-ribose) glycohydrolase (macronuclear) [Tetrahymena thermophila SB210]|uniref:Poly (ADP-ribose) glycohydrolase n=1 Tax=Tetrahymena thermophila (strain SB210) TaxID=312017 RepID=I7ME17_TETTS|nr:poly (ADP-ribose) glycohydrolase [Tetrahymena thermophila SB210]EAR93857.4 poly (ADP-ribose) glycohydrolase [Tetrahymena thermophila SB210]|eukprot:XP_001014102.4 poly (ADP-ribose) glycohydrolase [Tetrahymena thermophila SB210]